MAKIKILALGGLEEKQRRLYILEIDSKIFILDSGIYEPSNKDFGISQMVPNTEYLKLNRDKIKAIFLSSANKMNIGSIIQIVKLKKETEIFGSQTTIDSLGVFFGAVSKDWNTNIFSKGETKEVGSIRIKSIPLASSIPGALGYQFQTEDGNIIYLSDYIFDSINEFDANPIKDFSQLCDKKTLLLLSDSSNSTEQVAISSKFRIKNLVSKYLVNKGRFIISIYEDEIINAIELMELARENKRKIFFKSKTLFGLLSIMMENGNIEFFPIRLFDEYQDENRNESIIVLSGTRTKLYKKIELLIEEHNKFNFIFEKEDIVYFAALPQSGNEHIFASVLNKISRIDPIVIKPSIDEKKLFGTTEFDIRNIINLLNPEYFMPVSSHYKQLVAAEKIAIKNNTDPKKIIIGDNGEMFSFNNGVYEGVVQKIKNIEPMVIESIGKGSIDSQLIEERKFLGKDGIVTISFIYNQAKFCILSEIDIQMRGLVIFKGQEKVVEEIKRQIAGMSNKLALEKSEIWKGLPTLKKSLGRVFKENFKKIPMIQFSVMEL